MAAARPSLLARLRLRHAGLRQDDSGQALLATGILSLALLMFATSVMPVGNAVQRRIQTQNAADFAALSAGTWFARGANMLQAGFAGTLIPVNPKATEIEGLKVVNRIPDLPQGLDMAVITVPRDAVMPALKELAGIGVKSVIVITAGFKEVGADG